MVNCLTNDYVPLDTALYSWKWNTDEKIWEKLWYEGNSLPDFDEIDVNLEEDLLVEDEVDGNVERDDSSDEDDDESDEEVFSGDDLNNDSDDDQWQP